MYRLKLTKRAKKELNEIKKFYQEAIDAALEEIKENPYVGKPLARELIGRFSYKLGTYRIIYKINKKDKLVLIITFGHRSRVYK